MISRFIEFCRHLGPSLSEGIISDLEKKLHPKFYKKGTHLITEGEYCSKVFFVAKGLLKNGYWKDNREFIIRFCEENSISTDLESIYTKTPSKSFLTAIEDSEIIYVKYEDMVELLDKYHNLEKMSRIYHERTLQKTFAWNKEILGSEAQEIYIKFVKENPLLANRISLGDLSSYLGISQASLSRIRASLANTKS